jgi:hypothetical protein
MVHNLKMIGCYAQTELGHGSNVAVSDIKYGELFGIIIHLNIGFGNNSNLRLRE